MALPTIKCEIAFGTEPIGDYLIFDDTNRGKFNTGQFGPEEGVWTDVSAWLRSFDVTFGKTNGLDNFREATAQVVLDNRDDRFDPSNLSGPYVSAGESQVRPMKRIRVSTTDYLGTTVVQFVGFIDDWILQYRQPGDAYVTVPASDGTKVLSNFDPPAASSPVGESELSGARIGRLLDLASWPGGDRDLDTGEITLQATTLAQNVWTEIQLVADTEAGDVFFSKDGKLRFRDRYWLFEDSRSTTIQATFGEVSPELEYVNVVRANDADLVRNTVSIARAGGEAATATDTTSQSRYLEKSYNRTDLLFEDDAESQVLADGVVYMYGDRRERIDSMEVAPHSNPTALWPIVLGVEIGDLWRVKRRAPGGTTITKDVIVVGWSHRVDASQDWRSTFRFADGTLINAGYLIFDSATLGKLDTGLLAPF